MDEQTTSASDPIVEDSPMAEPPQTEAPQTQMEPVSVAERPQGSLPFSKTEDRQENLVAPLADSPFELLPTTSETPTPHLPVDEAFSSMERFR